MKLGLILSREELSRLGIEVIVESWERVVSRQFIPQRIRKAYKKEFTEKERRYLSRMYHDKFYRWILVKGIQKQRHFQQKMSTRYIERGTSSPTFKTIPKRSLK